MFVAVIKMDNTYAVLINSDAQGFTVQGFTSQAVGLARFETMYQDAHGRSITMSASAVLNWLTMEPSIVEVADIETIRAWVGENPRTVRYSNVAGSFDGLPIADPKVGKAAWTSGARPRLMPTDLGTR
jgi:hypothetical protein